MLLVKQEYQIQNSDHTDKKYFLAVVFLLLFTVIFGFFNEVYRPHTYLGGEKTVEITSGMGSRQIAGLLKQEGIIRSKWIFIAYVSLIGRVSDLKPGKYIIGGQSSLADIAQTLSYGGTQERIITIPEGWNTRDIGSYLEKENIVSYIEFEKNVDRGNAIHWRERFGFLRDAPADASLEGFIFPDTYRIFIGSPVEEIIEKILKNFNKKLSSDLREEVLKQDKNIFETIILASLIEKEVISDEDRAIVSGILWKRMKLGIPLQVDATITYVKNQGARSKNQGDGRILIEDTKIDSPYNTYKYAGLPAGPISNPGLSAIRAAIFPKESPYLYYLSASDGRTIFSRTLEEHNKAKAKYLTPLEMRN